LARNHRNAAKNVQDVQDVQDVQLFYLTPYEKLTEKNSLRE